MKRMQAHFESIQRIAGTATLPHVLHYLSGQIAEELDLSELTERLKKGKGQPNTLTPSEKVELWDKLKILSFTRMAVALWAVTMVSLYIRVQVNILGRRLYIDTAHFHSHSLEDVDLIGHDDEQKFLSSADFLANDGLLALISNMQAAVAEVLKGKQLRDFFDTTMLHKTIMQILNTFMNSGSPYRWVDYLMPANARKLATASNSDDVALAETTKFDQLMVEAQAVLLSAEFYRITEISLQVVVEALVDEIQAQFTGGNLASGIELARLVPRVAQVGPSLLEEPSRNRFLKAIQSVEGVELFFTILYANMPNS
uniref:Uncharacterized protein MANES_06G008500 n=1 Tax=Rhizophora mucronata TaxID=61149 RepID=A0A2P2K014_RHIMU